MPVSDTATRVLAGLYERSGEIAPFDITEIAPLPRVTSEPTELIGVLHDVLLTRRRLAVPARRCHLTLRLPDAEAAAAVSRVLAACGARLLLAPGWGRRGRHHVGVVVGLAHASYASRIRQDLNRLEYSALVIEPGTWIPAITPDPDGTWRVLAHATLQDGVHVAEELLTDSDAAALLGRPDTIGHDDHRVHRSTFRPTDEMLALYRRVFLPVGGHVLALGPEGKAISAPHVHRLTPWDAVAAGHAFTAALRSDMVGFDFDSATAIKAALIVQQRLGLPPLVVWHSGSRNHLAGLTRVAPVSMADLADTVHDTEAAICAERSLPRPDRMVVRGGPGARMRPPASPSVKRGALVGSAIGLLRGLTEDDDPIIEWVTPSEVPGVLGLGERPVVLPRAWIRGETPGSTEGEPSDNGLRRSGVSRSREGIVATTAASVIATWGLSGDAAMALTLPRSELLDRAATRIDTSRWVGSLLWALIIRGATEAECVAAVEACAGLGLGYKGGLPGTSRLAARIRWEAGRVRQAIDTGPSAGQRVGSGAGRSCTEAVLSSTAQLWATWDTADPAELVTAAALLGIARTGRRLGHLGVGVRRMGASTGCTPETAARRLRRLAGRGRIELTREAYFDPVAGWRADRYDLIMDDAAPAIPGRPPLEVLIALQTARLCWVRGVTPGALLALASVLHYRVVTLEDLTAQWGLTNRQARAAAERVAGVRTSDSGPSALATFDSRTGELVWRKGASLATVARLTGAAARYATAFAAAQEERRHLKSGSASEEREPVATARDEDRIAPILELTGSSTTRIRAEAA